LAEVRLVSDSSAEAYLLEAVELEALLDQVMQVAVAHHLLRRVGFTRSLDEWRLEQVGRVL